MIRLWFNRCGFRHCTVAQSDHDDNPVAPSSDVNPLSVQLSELARTRLDSARPLLPQNSPRRAPPARGRRDQRPDVRVPDGEPSESDKLKIGEFFKVTYYSETNPGGHEYIALVKKQLHDRHMVLVDNNWRTFLNRRIGRVLPVRSDNAAPLTRSALRGAASQ